MRQFLSANDNKFDNPDRCIYLIDPKSIMSSTARRARSSLPTRTRSQATLKGPNRHDESEEEYSEDDAEYVETTLTMDPAELRVIKRLAARVNVLPVIARSDELIESRLRAVKKTVNRELRKAGLGFGVFAPSSNIPPVPTAPAPESSHGHGKNDRKRVSIAAESSVESHHEEEEPERSSRPVIRIRPTRGDRSRSRRRSSILSDSPVRGGGDDSDAEQPPLPDGAAQLEVVPGRITKSVIETLLPFALVSPQAQRASRKSAAAVNGNGNGHGEASPPGTPLTARSTAPPSAFPSALSGAGHDADAPREFPRGKYVRKYKWGTLDVLDPAHCDFVALRTAIFGVFFKVCRLFLSSY